MKNIGLWWRYGISRHCDEWKYIIIERIFESEIILIPPSLKISESSFNGSYRNTDEVWWRYGISRSCDECLGPLWPVLIVCLNFKSRFFQCVFSWLLNISTVLDSTTFAGNLFHVSTTRWEKLYFLILVLECFFLFIYLMFMSSCTWFISRKYCVTVHFVDVVNYLEVSTRSDLILLYCSDGSPRYLILSV